MHWYVFWSILVIAAWNKINGKILRLSCTTEADFDVYFVGKRLNGSRLATFNNVEDTDCMVKCIEHQKCSSYNYQFNEKICEINNNYVQLDNATNLKDAENWIYKTTNYSKTLIGPTCRKLNPCKPGILCVEKCSCPFYECVHCNESMTGLHCDIPLDVDECAKNPCVNAESCVDKVNDYECKCKPGYEGKNCQIDIDECYSLPCINGGTCRNNIANYSCECPNEYQGTNCETDADECISGKHNCHTTHATCTNSVGSFSCSCNAGYTGDGRNCTDVDECTTGDHNCHTTLSTCTNSAGTFSCSCNAGYTGDGRNCNDADECISGMHNCHTTYATCTNTDGSFSCSCNAGYTGDGRNCIDIDECVFGSHNCHNTLASCTNSPGTFSCSCNNGYTGDGTICTDVDECTTGNHNCHSTLATCTNSLGAFSCSCKGGCTGDGTNCIDVDECALGNHNCDTPRAICANSVGSFSCSCIQDHIGDGKNCISNIALQKPTNQSSLHIFSEISLVSTFGNDGNYAGNWEVCSWTKADTSPWWQIDLTREAVVEKVSVKSGTTFAQTKIDPFYLSVGNDPSNGGQNNPLCVNEGQLNGKEKFFTCPSPLLGRYVSVFLEKKENLQVCEVAVYEAILQRNRTSQASTYKDWVSGEAVDGQKSTCSHTAGGSDNEWWMVDVGRPFYIESINVTNREPNDDGDFTNRLSDFTVRVGNTNAPNMNPICKANASFPNAGTKQLWCDKPLRGRYISIKQNMINEALTLCEVAIN